MSLGQQLVLFFPSHHDCGIEGLIFSPFLRTSIKHALFHFTSRCIIVQSLIHLSTLVLFFHHALRDEAVVDLLHVRGHSLFQSIHGAEGIRVLCPGKNGETGPCLRFYPSS